MVSIITGIVYLHLSDFKNVMCDHMATVRASVKREIYNQLFEFNTLSCTCSFLFWGYFWMKTNIGLQVLMNPDMNF